ncbi:hypothetical protein RF11_01895 [Thelohanellus kitauei]|uniref:Uncharacterized protein n=1 Tax=Thelohanellus kitauei TaxID=669202 RepID=A0A0C2IMK6_THEKT|nr:hypothetical protein RF11_01895 [Thelohanellus kitauei]
MNSGNVVDKSKRFQIFVYTHQVFKPAPVHFGTDFTSTASATVSTYGRDVLQLGTLLQAVRVVQGSHLLNTHPYPQPTWATIPSWHSFAGNHGAISKGLGMCAKYPCQTAAHRNSWQNTHKMFKGNRRGFKVLGAEDISGSDSQCSFLYVLDCVSFLSRKRP